MSFRSESDDDAEVSEHCDSLAASNSAASSGIALL